MAIKRPKPEEIVVKLRQVEVLDGARHAPYWMASLGMRDLVHGPGQDGAGTLGQFSCSNMGSVLSFADSTNTSCSLQPSLI